MTGNNYAADSTTTISASHVAMSMELILTEDHPLALELSSLRQAVNHYQVRLPSAIFTRPLLGLIQHTIQIEAHRATIQLQHASLEHATVLQRLHTLENENGLLREELHVHRSRAPGDKSHRESLQVQELTLALRRLSDKLDLTEKALLNRNEELESSRSAQLAAKHAEEIAMQTTARLRSELEDCLARERELMNRLRASDEQRKMSDLVVEEYANLVRSLEGRPSLGSRANRKNDDATPRSSLDGLMHARQGLHKLLQDSNSDSEKLHADITRLHSDLDTVRSELEVERAAAQEDRRRLAQLQLEHHRLRPDDDTAAKIVSRYMYVVFY